MSRRAVIVILFAPSLVVFSCGDTTTINQVFIFDGSTSPTPDANASIPDASTTDAQSVDASAPCLDGGLACQVIDCGSTGKTSLRGKVFDPAAANVVYGATVYIPDGPTPDTLPPLEDSMSVGVSCSCDAVKNPLRISKTSSAGEFLLDDVPVGPQIPVVVQLGKWRRLIHVDILQQCASNEVPDRTLRLPRNTSEGNLPHIAVATAAFDAMECFIRGVGVDESEFVLGDSPAGHIHLFKSKGGGLGPPAEDWWNNSALLRRYDMTMLGCEGEEVLENKGGVDAGGRISMVDYLNAGGKVIAAHYSDVWFKDSPLTEVQQVATWGGGGTFAAEYTVNTTFSDGLAYAEWLQASSATPTLGKIALSGVTSSMIAAATPTVTWISSGPTDGPKMISFDTPIAATPTLQCGRAAFLDLHVIDSPLAPTNLNQCIIPGGLNATQKAVEFMFFRLGACNH